MLKELLLRHSFLLILIGFASKIQAQCPSGDVRLFSQADVDQFALDYPNCTELNHGLTIKAVGVNDIENLEPLSNLEYIYGELLIFGDFNSDLDNLAGLRNLKEVNWFHIDECNLTYIDDSVNFQINEKLWLEKSYELTNFANISLVPNLIHFRITSMSSLEPEFYSILKEIQTVESLSLKSTKITSLGEEYNIEVTDIFRSETNFNLEDISGLNFGFNLTEFRITSSPEIKNSIPGLLNLESAFEIRIQGGNLIKDLPPMPSLQRVLHLTLTDLPEMNDLSSLEQVEIGWYLFLTNLGISSLENLHFIEEDQSQITIHLTELNELENLSSLTALDTIRTLRIDDCENLSSLEGLEPLQYVHGNLELVDLPLLEDVIPLAQLERVDELQIVNCNLNNLEGLEELKLIEVGLMLEGNQKLEHIEALVNLESLGSFPNSFYESYLTMSNNELLSSINPLSRVNANLERLQITGNPLLMDCSIAPVCKTLSNIDATVRVENNSSGCNSNNEVTLNCRSNQVLVFHDLNQNTVRDADEKDLPVGRINVNDVYEILSNNVNGNFSFYDAGENGFIEYLPEENWEVTGLTAIYNLTSGSTNHIEIGITPTVEINDVDVSLAFDAIICDRDYALRALVKNSGTTYKNVNLAVKGVGNTSTPTDADGFTEFVLLQMRPGEIRNYFLSYSAPDVTQVTPGDLIELQAEVSFEDGTGVVVEKSKEYEFPFLCAYDPNDKAVFPAGVQDENYTLFEDNTLEYKIRFQNTGNFPAQDIVIVDTLSEFLNLNTLQLIHSSHPVTEIKLDRNVVAFTFEDIYLIDSIANEPESHGYVQFSIETLEDLDEFTEINNTAHIYFDSNPAIVTNTVFNTFVSEIPMGTSIKNLTEQGFKLMPNPTKDFITIETTFAERDKKWAIYNQLGQEVMQGQASTKIWEIDLSELESGVYYMVLNNVANRILKIE